MSRNHARLHQGRWERTRRQAFERDGWRCVKCGKAGKLEAHHEPPLEAGADPYDLAGLKTLCRNCHIREHHPPNPEREEWRDLVRELASG